MSYILDALRRADSERERGAVPGVHAQALPAGAGDADAPPASRRWLVVSAALAVALAGVVGWQWFGRTEPPPPAPEAAAVRAPLPVTEPPPPSPPPAAVAAVPAPAPVAPAPAPAVAPKPAPRPAPVVAARVAPSPPPASAAARPAAPAVAPAPPAPPPRAEPVSPPPVAAAPARIPMASELPDDVRAGLPTITVGGASYSQNPENRMLIVNGQVFREGDKLSADVTLEQIRLKEAVLSTKGVRYRIAY